MITFNETEHKYYLGGKELQSVSKWIEQFTPEFNSDFISLMVAKKRDCTQEEVLKEWEMKKNISLHQGNWVHESIELYLKHDSEFENEPVKAFKELQSKNKYHSEIIVHDDKNAGTIDLIEVLGNKKVILHDFKTNNDLYKKHGKMLEPYKELQNMPINKYRLQLSKYKEMLEKMKDVEVVELNLWWWNEGKFEVIKIEPIKI